MLKRNLHQGLISLKILLIMFVVIETSYEQLDHQHSHKPLSNHFVLVHGSCLGAWSWYKLLPLLKSSGHTVTAIDLAASGINPLQPNDLQSISEYFQPLTDMMVSLPFNDRVILVGHSLGGLAISHAMQHFPDKISVGVFVTAQMPGPALTVSILSQEVYDLSPPEDIALATTLMRPLRLFSMQDMSEVIVLTDQKYGSVPRVYIISEEDRIMDKEVERWMLKKNPPNRVEKIRGSDHMVMVSQPLQLWAHLQSIAADFG
uniref:AB hydrolase-1 domain-containing protein n=1 Tax=Chenopodium quinoa TaxID=63459 RepID=A0A803LNW1_CHEQI